MSFKGQVTEQTTVKWSIILPHSYRGKKLHRDHFSFAVILHSLFTEQQTRLVPSTREVTIDPVDLDESPGQDEKKRQY